MSEIPLSATVAVGARRWPWRLAMAFVLLTLVALVSVPLIVQQRVDALRTELEASEPARTLVTQWQFNLVREMAALSELLLSGDASQAAAYRSAWSAERVIHEELAGLAARMGPEVVRRFAEARTLANQWHERVDEEEFRQLRDAGTALMQIPRERQLFENVLRAIAAVDSAIVRATAYGRARIFEAEQTGLTFTLVLGVLALLAAIAVVAIEVRVRRLAAEARARRAQADAALAESARAAEARHRLLRGITHDVKNPLGAAKGYVEVLVMGIKAPLAPDQAPLVEGIGRSIDSALAIIADLLDLERVDSGGVSLKRVEVDLNDLARAAVADYRAAARTSRHTLDAEAAPDPLIVHTDPVRLRQVLDNLLSNAIKYTPPPGSIIVRVAAVHGEVGPRPGSWAAVEVSDTGPGIPPERREEVFDEFARLDEGAPAGGHGLGLAVARGLARRLGGDLTIADAERGATFVLWLPRRDAQTIPADERVDIQR